MLSGRKSACPFCSSHVAERKVEQWLADLCFSTVEACPISYWISICWYRTKPSPKLYGPILV
jgi:hypothetical protein